MNTAVREPLSRGLGWFLNFLVAIIMVATIGLTAFTIHEYIMLNNAEGDAGYPFGCEEAGPGYETKEIYLAQSRWIIGIGSPLSITMLYALWRKRWTLLMVTSLTATLGFLLVPMILRAS